MRILLANERRRDDDEVAGSTSLFAPTARAILETLDKLGSGEAGQPWSAGTRHVDAQSVPALAPRPIKEDGRRAGDAIEEDLTPCADEIERLADLAREIQQ